MCETRQDQYLLLAADQLDPAEAEALRRHLADGCPACAGAWAEAQAVFAAIGAALEPEPVPVSAERTLMARIAGGPVGMADSRAAARTTVRSGNSWAGVLFRMGVSAAVAAGVAVVVTHHLVTERTHRSVAALLSERDARINTLLTELVHVQQHQQATFALLQGPALKLARLDGQGDSKATAQLLLNSDTRQWALLTSNLAPLPAGRTYEFWYITPAGQKLRAGTFSVDSSGSAALEDQIPADVGSVTVTAVTDEPAGGSDQPTGLIRLVGKLP